MCKITDYKLANMNAACKTAICLVHIFMCIPINAYTNFETACPNNFKYPFDGKCYFLRTDSAFKYVDAVKECEEKGGVLWAKTSENEVHHLRRIHAKTNSDIWIGARDVGLGVWQYLSDNTSIPEEIEVSKSRRPKECLAMQENEDKLQPLPCKQKTQSLCTLSGEKCNSDIKVCHQFMNTEQDFNSAAEKCKLHGGELTEIRSSVEFKYFKEMIRKDKQLESIPPEKLNKMSGSKIPTIWMLTSPPIANYTCKIFKDLKAQACSCNWAHGYICMSPDISHVEDQITTINSKTEQSKVNSMTSNPHTEYAGGLNSFSDDVITSMSFTAPEGATNIQDASELIRNDTPSTIESVQQTQNNESTKQSTIPDSDPISTSSFTRDTMTHDENTRESGIEKSITTEQSASTIPETDYTVSTSSAEDENVSTHPTTISSSNPTPRIKDNAESIMKSSITTTEFLQEIQNNDNIVKSATPDINSSDEDIKMHTIVMIVMGILVIAGIAIIIVILINIMKKRDKGQNLRRNSMQLNCTLQRPEFARNLPRTPSDITVENSLYADVNMDEWQPLHTSTEDNTQHQYTYID